jgi:hypothetical protein
MVTGPVHPDIFDDDNFSQSRTACCPRQTIPDSCSCLEGCGCMCLDCDCGNWGDEDDGMMGPVL